MSVYTCNCCGIQFETSEAQRKHMKSDWHRYNLKRKVANLPAVAEDVFLSKVQASAKNEAEESGKKKQLTKKDLRKREKEALLEKKRQLLKLAEENARKNLEQQLKTQEAQADAELEKTIVKEETPSESPLETPEEELTENELAEKLIQQKIDNRVDIPLTECFFCGKKSNDIENNLEHMFKDHGFYIPEQKYLADRNGLLEYIAEKIGLGNVCLVCNFQGRSLEAVRAHMLAKRHCRIPYEEEDEKLEISQFYDFTSSYDRFEKTSEENNDEDWEDVDSVDDESIGEDDIPEDTLYHDGVELHLPTGIKIGHRSLQRYYKQNLKPELVLKEGQGTVIAADTRSFLTTFNKKDAQLQQKVWQTEATDKKRHDKRAAKFINQQKHYRDELLQ